MQSTLTIAEPIQDLKPLITGVASGSDERVEQQLIEKSRQPNIVKYTPKDATKRFGDQVMLDRWRSAGREIYWLLGANNDLAGIIWYGQKPFPLNIALPEMPAETFAIRLYEGYTGHGLAVPFMRQSLVLHVAAAQVRSEPVKGIWLETDTDNPAALATYTKFGYQEVHRDNERVTMVLPASQMLAMASKLTGLA